MKNKQLSTDNAKYHNSKPIKRGLFQTPIPTGINAQIEKYTNLMQFEHHIATIIGLIGIFGIPIIPYIKETHINLIIYIGIISFLSILSMLDLSCQNHFLAIWSLKKQTNPRKLTKLMHEKTKELNEDLYLTDHELSMVYSIKHLYLYFH